jgi:RNA polymerase sigma-70 factor (ECF subfamily)
MKDISDSEIIESVRKGNHSDYSLLIDKYKNKAFSMLKRMLKNDMDAEEVLQDSFLKAYNGLNNFRKEAKFSTWFYRIVYNSALTRLSSKRRRIEMEMSSIDDQPDLISSYDSEDSDKTDFNKFINDTIEQLPPKYASVINLFYLEGMSCEEISEVMSSTVSNVKVILHRSRNALKDLLIAKDYVKEIL